MDAPIFPNFGLEGASKSAPGHPRASGGTFLASKSFQKTAWSPEALRRHIYGKLQIAADQKMEGPIFRDFGFEGGAAGQRSSEAFWHVRGRVERYPLP